MDPTLKEILDTSYFYIIIAILMAGAVLFIAYMLISRSKTVPSGSKSEGFQGPAVGVSSIPCGQESSHVTEILNTFSGLMSSTQEGAPDFVEFKEIMSKMCCMKHDLMSTSHIVNSTLYLHYNNSHDRENPADTVGRCFTKSVPPRELGIIFTTWKNRGLTLLARLCTSYNLCPQKTKLVEKHFNALCSDVFDIAKECCLPEKKAPEYNSPRDPRGVMPPKVQDLGEYKGYY